MRQPPQTQISERALTVWKASATIVAAIGWSIVVLIAVLTIIFNWPAWISIVLFVLSVSESVITIFIIPKIKWKQWRYDVFEQEIDLQSGVLVIKRTLIPMIRVQHVDTKQGPILRKYRLATVTISTAATVHEIPALDEEEANQLRDYISKLARVDNDDI